MAFLVSFKGQFKPYTLPDLSHYDRVRKVRTSEQAHQVASQNEEHHPQQPEPKKSQQARKISKYEKAEDVAKKMSPRHFARDIMTSPVHNIEMNSSRSELIEKMSKYNVRHMPVLKGGVLVGIVSDRDLLLSKSQFVEEIMSGEVLSALENVSISDLARIMLHEKFSALPIISQDNELIGIVTQTDILKFVITNNSLQALA